MRRHTVAALMLLPPFVAGLRLAAQEPQRFTGSERRIELWDAAGTITVRKGAGGDVVITARRSGPDGSALSFGFDHQGDLGVFRVVFPVDRIDRIADPRPYAGSRTTVHLRADGTFGGDRGERGRGHRGAGDEVEIGGSGGFRGWGDLDIEVPDGRTVTLHLASGKLGITGVAGDISLDLSGADVEATDISGRYRFDTGSGDVKITGANGTLRLDTGSGDAVLSRVTGDLLDIDTGSGDVQADHVSVESTRLDTGSGDVRMRSFRSRHATVDTGSGDAELEYVAGPIDDLSIDTGSGDCTLTVPRDADARIVVDPGSGDITVARAGAIFERRDEDETVLRLGEGRGRIKISTGSGGVTIR